MDVVREVRKKYCPAALLVAIGVALIMILSGHRELARGLILGTLFSIVNFLLMGMSIQLRMQKTRRASTIISFLLVMLRFGILVLPLMISIYYDNYHTVTTIVGLFMVQAVMLADSLRKMLLPGQN